MNLNAIQIIAGNIEMSQNRSHKIEKLRGFAREVSPQHKLPLCRFILANNNHKLFRYDIVVFYLHTAAPYCEAKMNALKSISEKLWKNPLALLAFSAFALAEYANYQHGSQLTVLCSVIEPATVVYSHPKTRLQEAQKICSDRDAEPIDD